MLPKPNKKSPNQQNKSTYSYVLVLKMLLFWEKSWLKDYYLMQSCQGGFAADIRLLQDLRDLTRDIGKSNLGLCHKQYVFVSVVATRKVKTLRNFTVLHAGGKCPCNLWRILNFLSGCLLQELKKFPGLREAAC